MFNTASIDATVQQGGSKYITPGINEGVKILSITTGASAKKGTPFLALEFSKGEEQDARKMEVYMSDSAQNSSLKKLIHLFVDGFGVDRKEFDAAGEKATDLASYANELKKLLRGKGAITLKLQGEEYTNASGEVKVKSVLGFPPFAEPAGTTPSSLTYNPSNPYDFKKLPVPQEGASPVAQESNSELPF